MSDAIDMVVLGSSPTGLYVVREAARAGLRVRLVDTARGCAFHSRYVAAGDVVGTAELGEWLRVDVSESRLPLVVPTSDVWIEALMLAAPTLVDHGKFFHSYTGLAGLLLDKLSFHDLCREHGVDTPGVWHAGDGDALRALGGEVPFPCIMKPVLIHRARNYLRGRKVLLARSKEEFLSYVDALPEDVGGWLVQEIIPGEESRITLFGGYIAQDGTPSQVFTGRKLRQYPSGFGSASLVTSVACGETLDLTLGFLDRIGFRGICGAEYKRDPRDGRLKMIEINPRPTLWFQITHDAGCRIVEAAWRDLTDQPPLPRTHPSEDACWRYLFKDVASAAFYRRSKNFIFPPPNISGARVAGKRSWPVFQASDPVPALAEPFGFLRKAMERSA